MAGASHGTPTSTPGQDSSGWQRPARSLRYLGYAGLARYVVLIPLAILFLFPFYLMVRNALMTQPEITGLRLAVVAAGVPQWEQFRSGSSTIRRRRWRRGCATRRSSPASTWSSRPSSPRWPATRWPGFPVGASSLVFAIILSTLMVPSAVTFIPSYVVVSDLGGVDTLWGIVVPGLFNAFATFLFRQFYLDFPVEIEEAGRLDGLGYFGIYRRLILPNSLGDHDGARHPLLHLQLERLPLAAGGRPHPSPGPSRSCSRPS